MQENQFCLSIQVRTIPLTYHTQLTQTDIPELQAQSYDEVVALVNPNPKNPAILGLKNCSIQTWTATLVNGEQRQIETGRTIQLEKGTQINFGSITATILSQKLDRTSPKPLDEAKAYNNRGNARLAAGDREGALRNYDRAISLDPNYAPAYYNRGLFRYQLGEREGALSDYNRALSLEPGNALAHYNRGIVRYELGDKSGAVADYSEAIALNPTLTLAYYNRGIARYYLGEREAAAEDLNQAIALDSTYPPAYYNRGNIRARLADLEGASADFQKAADLYREQGNEEGYQGALERISKLRE